jgi:selenide,water dikinase
MVAPLVELAGADERILVGPETGDDAGVFRFEGTSLIATVDFITPVCDDPVRFGRVAAANSISDVWAMGGRPLFALNLCCFPKKIPHDAVSGILEGGARALRESETALLGGHTVEDDELKFGLAVVGQADPDRLMTNAAARPGQRLILTKPVGTGVMINAFKLDKLDAAGLEPALVEMERLNAPASRLAVDHGVRGATDITGFGLAGHALNVARSSDVGIRIDFDRIPTYEAFARLVAGGMSTGSTKANGHNVEGHFEDRKGLDRVQRELMFDPQTSGGLLLAVPPDKAEPLLRALLDSGHRAAEIGEVVDGPPRVIVD